MSGTLAAVLVAFLSEDAFGSASIGVLHIGGQGASFAAAGAAFVVDIVVSVVVTFMTAAAGGSRSCVAWSTR